MQLFYYKKVAEEALELAAVHFDKSNPDHSGLLVVSDSNILIYFLRTSISNSTISTKIHLIIEIVV